jgi:hypothetical protein
VRALLVKETGKVTQLAETTGLCVSRFTTAGDSIPRHNHANEWYYEHAKRAMIVENATA